MEVYYTRRGLKFIFRCGPVPDIGHYHNSCRSYMRRPKTTQERRKWFGAKTDSKEYNIKLRMRRSARVLPNAYDDLYAADNYIRGWKRTKKQKQWM
jgi:hypothetical protein